MPVTIRPESPEDFPAIHDLVRRAFEHAEHADGDEQHLVDRLRRSREYIPELTRSYNGDEVPVSVVLGGKHGETLSLLMPRVKMQMPSVDENDTFVVLNREGAALGTVGNDSLYIIQE